MNLKASEIVRHPRHAFEEGTDDPDPERCSVPLPAVDHLDAYRHQLPRLSVSGQPEPLRIEAAFAPIRAHSRALHRLCIRGDRAGCHRYSPLLFNDVSAWRLASSHLEHVDAVAVRSDRRGSAGSWPLSGVLSRLRPGGFDRARHVQSDFDRTRIRRLWRNPRHSRVPY